MRKGRRIVLGLLPIFFLASCGMEKWPYCDLPNAVATYGSIFVETIVNHPSNNGSQTKIHKYSSESPEVVLAFYKAIEAMHVAPKKSYRVFNAFWQKVSILFKKEDLSYKFQFYELKMTDGYFVFDNGDIYAFKGDFFSVTESVVKKI